MSSVVLGHVLAAFLTGLAGGALFAGALWLTVAATIKARRPGAWLVASFALRLAAVITVLFFAARLGGWPALLAATAGFLVARSAAVGLARRRAPFPTDAT